MSEEARFLKSDEDGTLIFCDEKDEDVEFALIPVQEYNGYCKAVRIVRDRAKQQIDKAQADEHGYTLVEMERYDCDRKRHICWKITKSTPYSLNMSLEEAYAMVRQDMYDYYGFRELPYSDRCLAKVKVPFEELVQLVDLYEALQQDGSDRLKDFATDYDGGQYVIDNDSWIVSDIVALKCNRARGVYVVTYLSTRPV